MIGIAAIVVLVVGAIMNIDINGKADINKPIPWIIIIVIFTPISIGLMIFGWYAIKGEYNKLPPGVQCTYPMYISYKTQVFFYIHIVV